MFVVTEETQNQIFEVIYSKASNNKEGEAIIKPSEFGFKHSMEETIRVSKWLSTFPEFKNVKENGKDSIIVTIYR